MFSPYAAVLRTRGALAFSSAGFVARLPISMIGLGMVLLVSARTGSYGLAGAVSAVYVLANSVAAPVQARIADRFGQAAMLWPLIGAQCVGVVLFLVAARPDPQTWQLMVSAALVGATQPQIGSLVRARWSAAHGGTPLLHTAFALESVIDEAIFVLGPVVVTVLATQVHPYAGLAVALAFTVVGGVALALQRSTQPSVAPVTADEVRPRLPVAALSGLVLGFVALGSVFGALDVAVIAAADQAGNRGIAGVVIACFAFGSLLAGIVYGALHLDSSLQSRLLGAHLLLAVAVLPLPFLPGLGWLAAAALVVGVTISPTLVTGFMLIEQVVPGARLTEGLAWVSTALGAGVAAGASLAGAAIDRGGAVAGMWVLVASAWVAVVPAAVTYLRDRRRRAPIAAGRSASLPVSH